MDIPTTFLSLIEATIVGMLTGASTLAVIAYAVCLRYGHPDDGVGRVLIRSIYTLIRLFHVFFAILATLLIIVYGMLDGVVEAWFEYGIKLSVLSVNAVIAYSMSRRIISVHHAAPAVAAGWYFLSTYHTYVAHVSSTAVLFPILWYLFLLAFLQVVFSLLRLYIRPLTKKTS